MPQPRSAEVIQLAARRCPCASHGVPADRPPCGAACPRSDEPTIGGMDLETRAIHGGQGPGPAKCAVTTPIHRTSTYLQALLVAAERTAAASERRDK